MADDLTEILRAANKHPNSRVSKLIHSVQEECSQKNIVLLLIELADHAEYSTDFNISLKYYLELFDRLGINSDLVLNEAGLLLVNSSKIYSKRVDYVQSLVERQILTLSNADNEVQQQKLNQQESSLESTSAAEKPKRGRKRALEVQSDPYEVELAPKKFKKLSEEKRFSVQKIATKAKSIQRNIEMEQHIHPAGWMHATIYDLENEEDVDTKRNYKLFTFHVEHRYNTLVPDINFRLHFKVKDYMDAQEEEMDDDDACNTDREWPPLSEEYVQKYIKLENYVLQQDIQSTKRKAMTIDDDYEGERENNKDLSKKQVDNVEKMDISAINESQNDSGLGHSLLDESNKTDTTLDATQLDITMTNTLPLNNTTLDTSATSANLNDANLTETDKSLNSLNENDSALGISLLDQTNNNDLNSLDTTSCNETNETSAETSRSLGITNGDDSCALDQSNNTKPNSSAEISGNCNETLNGTSADTIANLDSTNCNETTECAENNKFGTNSSETEYQIKPSESPESNETSKVLEGNSESKETEEKLVSEKLTTNSDSTMELKENLNAEELLKATDARKDSALGDDRHHSISTENLAIISIENFNQFNEDNGKSLEIDVIDNVNGDRSQIRIHLPNMDDEGVYLSDLEEQDHRMLSPNIVLTNILPCIQRKDITITMDDELMQALELRDGMMEHFGRETYKVPVVTEPKKQNLYFNILKLPEKIIRRKVLFKLGPEMELYLQARSFKRLRTDPQPREFRTTKLLEWYALNNTDMTGITMTPPNSPDHLSEFCGFTDNEDNDVDSCSEFCGFSAEEQASLLLKNLNRLSRDSGVGVEVNRLTSGKEPMEIIFGEQEETSGAENCKENISLEENKESKDESTDSILNQLSSDIRDALTAEISDGIMENCTEKTIEIPTETMETNKNSSQQEATQMLTTENACENSTDNTDETQKMSTENCSELLVNSTKAIEETEKLSTENSIEKSIYTIEQAMEEKQQIEVDGKTQEITPNQSNITEEINKASVNDSEINNCDENKFDENVDHHVDNADSEDDTILDWDTQGNKTKIQQWHEHLQPILAKSRERHHFDVFKLGTEIIETVQSKKSDEESASSTSPPVALFKDIMDNKDKSYVSRYFLSTLLLANQSNVEISIKNKSSEHPSSWQDIQLKLLSTKRHTVAIEDNIGMIRSNKNTAQKENVKTKSKEIKPSRMEVDEEDEDEPLIKLQGASLTSKNNKKSKTINKRTSDNLISSAAEKKPKESITTTQHNSISRPIESFSNLITNVQYLPPLTPTTNASSASSVLLPQLNIKPSTSRQAKDLQALEVNLNSIRTLQPIEKVPSCSDDYDSGIFSIGELST